MVVIAGIWKTSVRVCIHSCVPARLPAGLQKVFSCFCSLLSIRRALKINPLTDHALETLRVEMGEECVGASLRIAVKKPGCIDDEDATDTCCWQNECLVAFLFLPAAGMSLS